MEPNLEVLDRRDSGVFPLELVAREGAFEDGAGVPDIEDLSENFKNILDIFNGKNHC